jgi:hypothetical protein
MITTRACAGCSAIAALAPEEIARLDALGAQALGPPGSLSQL